MRNFYFLVLLIFFLNNIYSQNIEFEINTISDFYVNSPVLIQMKLDETKIDYNNLKKYKIYAIFKNIKYNLSYKVYGFFKQIEDEKFFCINFTPIKKGKWIYKIKLFYNKNLIFKTKWKDIEINKGEKEGFIRVSKVDPLFLSIGKKPIFLSGIKISFNKIDEYFLNETIKKIIYSKMNFIFLDMDINNDIYSYSFQKKLSNFDKLLKKCYENQIYLFLNLNYGKDIKKLIYFINRYSYNPVIMGWEVKENKEYETIKKYDNYKHLTGKNVYNKNINKFDFLYVDTKINNNSSEEILYNLREVFSIYEDKPYISILTIKNNGSDDFKIKLHNSLWAGTLSLSFGTPIFYVEENEFLNSTLFEEYKELNEFLTDINFPEENLIFFNDSNLYFMNPENYNDFIIFPTNKEKSFNKNKFLIKENGRVINKKYLYNRIKNKSIKFILTNKKEGKFILHITKCEGNNKLTVKLNENKILYFDLKEKKEKEIVVNLPAGDNELILQNQTDGYIEFDYIKITKFLPPKIVPAFISGIKGDESAYIWVKNLFFTNKFDDYLKINDSYILIKNLKKYRYKIIISSPFHNKILKQYDDIVDTEILKINLPSFDTDIAIKVKKY